MFHMSICPVCASPLKYAGDAARAAIRCPTCGHIIIIAASQAQIVGLADFPGVPFAGPAYRSAHKGARADDSNGWTLSRMFRRGAGGQVKTSRRGDSARAPMLMAALGGALLALAGVGLILAFHTSTAHEPNPESGEEANREVAPEMPGIEEGGPLFLGKNEQKNLKRPPRHVDRPGENPTADSGTPNGRNGPSPSLAIERQEDNGTDFVKTGSKAAPAGWVWLTDLAWKDRERDNLKRTHTTVDDAKTPKGIGLELPGNPGMEFELKGKYTRFRGEVRLTDNHKPETLPVTFEIRVDNKLLWESKMGTTRHVRGFDVDVSNGNMLVIKASSSFFGDKQRAVWLEPMLMIDDGTP